LSVISTFWETVHQLETVQQIPIQYDWHPKGSGKRSYASKNEIYSKLQSPSWSLHKHPRILSYES